MEGVALLLIVVGTLTRLLPHPPNMTAVMGVTVFAAYAIRNPVLGALVPIAAMVLADFVLGWHGAMLWTYAAMLFAFVASRVVLARLSLGRIAGAALLASAIFFVVSNLGVFAGGYYGYGWDGLVACFVAAIPFWQNSLIGDLVSTAVIFAAFLLAGRYVGPREAQPESP